MGRLARVQILETSLYHDSAQRDQMERFYTGLLGLPRVAGWPDGMAFRLGDGVLLIFDRELIKDREEPMAQHGTSGPGHVCLLDAEGYEDWKQRIADAGVEITHEHEWDGGRRSFYFQDPAGNLLEIADGDLWPPASQQ
jgi:catechol 2,3-dioxygenase-like lactoylglutathione lyase family enzyme